MGYWATSPASQSRGTVDVMTMPKKVQTYEQWKRETGVSDEDERRFMERRKTWADAVPCPACRTPNPKTSDKCSGCGRDAA